MIRKERSINVSASPHMDGKYEGIVNDPTGDKVGVQIDQSKVKNPFQVYELHNKDMKEFERQMRGKDLDHLENTD